MRRTGPERAGAGPAAPQQVSRQVVGCGPRPAAAHPLKPNGAFLLLLPPGLCLPRQAALVLHSPQPGVLDQHSVSGRGLGGSRAGSWPGSEWGLGGGGLFLNPRLCWGFPQCLQHLWLCLLAIAKPAPGSRLQTSELQAWWKEAYDATFQ